MKKKQKKDGLREMLLNWEDRDLVKAGYNYNYIEQENRDAFARGWRCAVHSIIIKLDEFDL